MDVVGRGSVRVGSVLWQPAPGAFSLTVVGKVTFSLAPGESPLAEEQEEVYEVDAYWDDDPRRSLVQSTDLVPGKSRSEVLLVGSAYAPDQSATDSITVRLRVGDVDKSIAVWGDRWFSAAGELEGPTKFARMPLSWERTAGGLDTMNPVGIGMGRQARPDAWGRTAVPNLAAIGSVLRSRHETFAPVCFGPIAPTWSSRAARLPGRGAAWDPVGWSRMPMPSAFDFGFWNAAPPDQQIPVLRGDEPLFLENLDRRHARLSTRLTAVQLRGWLEWAGGGSRAVALASDTLIIDTDRALAMLVFRGVVALDHPERAGRVTLELTRPSADPEMTIAPQLMRISDHLLPFRVSDADASHTMAPGFEASSPALPFARGISPSGPEWLAHTPAQVRHAAEDELNANQPASLDAMRASHAQPLGKISWPLGTGMPEVTLPLSPSSETLSQLAEAAQWSERPAFEERSQHAKSPSAEEAPFSDVDADTVPPPPMVGPLATPEMGLAIAPARSPEVAAALPIAEPLPGGFVEAEPPPLPLDDVPLVRCAALDASIACRPSEKAEILKSAGLDAPVWSRIEGHYASMVRAETRRSKSGSLRAYDAAYVGQIERERGPISADDFAALLVANERGELGEVLERLRMPNAEMIRIQRVWILRSASDPVLGASIKEATVKARAVQTS